MRLSLQQRSNNGETLDIILLKIPKNNDRSTNKMYILHTIWPWVQFEQMRINYDSDTSTRPVRRIQTSLNNYWGVRENREQCE